MGTQRDASYYDANYATSDYQKPAHDSPWTPLWRAVLAEIPNSACVLDIGCGGGHLAALWKEEGRRGVWVGVDFSRTRIDAAHARKIHRARFYCRDIFSWLKVKRSWTAEDYDVFVLCEFLEHIDADIRLLESLPKDRLVVLTVPDFDSDAHVRHFASAEEVRERYGKVLVVEKVVPVGRWFLLRGRT